MMIAWRCACQNLKIIVWGFYAHQTKILEGRANSSECVSRDALFNGVSTLFGLHDVEKCFPWKRTLKCLYYLPESSFGKGKSFHCRMISDCVSEALFKGESTVFGLQSVPKAGERPKADFPICPWPGVHNPNRPALAKLVTTWLTRRYRTDQPTCERWWLIINQWLNQSPVKRALNCAISGPHLRNAVEYSVSTHIWDNFYTKSTNLAW
jgi:hypothetical protein